MFPLYFMVFFAILSDDSFFVDSYVNTSYVEPDACDAALPGILEQFKQNHSDIKNVTGFCIEKDWPFDPEKQPKGSI